MKPVLSLLFILIFSTSSYSSVIPSIDPLQKENGVITITPEMLSKFATLKIKEIEKVAGRKLTFKEKITIKVYQWQIKKRKNSFPKERKADKGNTSFILGIVGLVSLVLPYIGILAAIPCAILAIVFGNQAKKINPDDRQAKTGVILGWITLGLLVLFTLLIIALLASGGFWF